MKHKRHKETDFNSTDASIDIHEIISGNKHRKKHKRSKESHLNTTEVCTVFDDPDIIPDKYKKKRNKDKESEFNSTQICNVFDKSRIPSGNKYRKKHKKDKGRDLHTAEACTDFGELKLTSDNNNAKKRKKDKESELNTIEVATVFDEPNVTSNKHTKNQSKHTESDLNTTDVYTFFYEPDITYNTHKKKDKKRELNTTGFDVVDELDVISNKHKKKWKKGKESDLNPKVCTIFDEPDVPFNKHKKQKDKESELNTLAVHTVFDEPDKFFNKQKEEQNKGKENKLNTEACTIFDESEKIFGNKYKKPHKDQESDVNTTVACTTFDKLQMTSDDKQKNSRSELYTTKICTTFNQPEITSVKHKNDKVSYLNTTEAYAILDELDITSNKHKKKGKKEKASDLNTTKVCTALDEPYIISNKHKKKRNKDKESELNTTQDCTVFDELEKPSDNKYRKKHKKDKERNFYTTEACTVIDELQLISDTKHTKKQKKDKESELNNIEVFTAFDERDITSNKHRKKRKKDKESALDISETCTIFDEFDITSNKHKKKRKKDKESALSTTQACTGFDEPVITSYNHENKGHKDDLNDIQHYTHLNDTELNFTNTYENDKEYPDLSTVTNTVSYDYESTPTNRHKKKNKRDKENNYLNTAEDYTHLDNAELNCSKSQKKKHKKDESYGLNHTGAVSISDNSEITLANRRRKKHKKGKECDLNSTEVYTFHDNSELNFNEKHKTSIGSFDASIDAGNSNFEISEITTTKNRNKHKGKDCELNSTKEYTDLDNSELNVSFNDPKTVSPKRKRDKHKKSKKKEDSDVNVSYANLDNREVNFTEKDINGTLKITDAWSALKDYDFSSTNKHRNNLENDILNTETGANLYNSEFTEKYKRWDLNSTEACIITASEYRNDEESNNLNDFNNTGQNSTTKHRKKHKKKQKESNDLNITRTFRDEDAHQPISHTMETTNLVDCTRKYGEDYINNTEQNTSEIVSSSDDGVRSYSYNSLHLDCDEDPVDFEIPPLHKYEIVHAFTEKQRNDILSQRIFIKTGRYTKEEDNIIKRNYEDFAKKFGISDCTELLGIGRYAKDRELLNFIKAKHFYLRLAKGINNRTLSSVYRRARLILNPYRNTGRLTEKEVISLEKLRESLNNKWYRIGDTLGKSAVSCQSAYRWNEKPISKGTFTEEEKNQLIKAIKNVTGSSDLSCKSLQGISWEKVASYVPTRNFSQCRIYWANHLAWKSDSAKRKWDQSCYCKLVNILSKEWNVEDSSMIDWYKVYESFEDVAPSSFFVQKRWLYLKSRVPGYQNKSYRDIIKLLCKKYPMPQENH